MFLLLKSKKPFQCILSPKQEQAQRMKKAAMGAEKLLIPTKEEKLQTRQLKQ